VAGVLTVIFPWAFAGYCLCGSEYNSWFATTKRLYLNGEGTGISSLDGRLSVAIFIIIVGLFFALVHLVKIKFFPKAIINKGGAKVPKFF